MRCVHEPSGRITPLFAVTKVAKGAWRQRDNYAAQSVDIKVVVITHSLVALIVVAAAVVSVVVVAMVAANTAAAPKFQLYFELSAVCSYANMRNCI